MKRYFLSLASIFLGLMPVNANELPTFTLPDVVIYASSDVDTIVNAQQINIGAARTDTRYFHDYIYRKAKEIRFIKGRLKFGGAKTGAPFPSMIVIF